MEYIIVLLIGLVFLAIASTTLNKISRIKKNGIAIDGIIFDFQNNPNLSIKYEYPVVRFLTMENQWFTERSNFAGFNGVYKKGQKIKIVYEKTNPKNFFIDSGYSFLLTYGLLVIGMLLIAYGGISLVGIHSLAKYYFAIANMV
jgi:hypothetical protein